jgi:ferrous iron transport protein A
MRLHVKAVSRGVVRFFFYLRAVRRSKKTARQDILRKAEKELDNHSHAGLSGAHSRGLTMGCQCKLNQVAVGEKVRVSALGDCPKARGRLCALGLTPGTEVEVCSRNGGPRNGGPCSVKVRNCCVVLGNGMADQVLCEPLCDTADADRAAVHP